MTATAAGTTAPRTRPVAPVRSGRLFIPLLLIAMSYAIAGVLAGSTSGLLWGAAAGGLAAAVLRLTGITRDAATVGAVVASSALGLWLFELALSGRSSSFDFAVGLRSTVGWAIAGAGLGYALWRSRPGRRFNVIVVAALGFAVGGALSVWWASSIGYVDTLGRADIAANLQLPLSTRFYGYAGFYAALVGAGIALAIHAGKPVLAAVSASIFFTVYSGAAVGITIDKLFGSLGNIPTLATEFWPPEWTWPNLAGEPRKFQILTPMIETIQIAVVGATTGCLVALPIAFMASRVTTKNSGVFWVFRMFMNVVRTIPDLFWAMLFTASVGFGSPFAGALAMIMFSLGIMAKLLSETVDGIDTGPLEATRAAGARHTQTIHFAAMPQVLPNYVAYALYIFELNIRASVVIGIVGAGGIGRLLDEQRTFFQWDRVMAIVLVIFLSVILIEMVSVTFRRRLV